MHRASGYKHTILILCSGTVSKLHLHSRQKEGEAKFPEKGVRYDRAVTIRTIKFKLPMRDGYRKKMACASFESESCIQIHV